MTALQHYNLDYNLLPSASADGSEKLLSMLSLPDSSSFSWLIVPLSKKYTRKLKISVVALEFYNIDDFLYDEADVG